MDHVTKHATFQLYGTYAAGVIWNNQKWLYKQMNATFYVSSGVFSIIKCLEKKYVLCGVGQIH